MRRNPLADAIEREIEMKNPEPERPSTVLDGSYLYNTT